MQKKTVQQVLKCLSVLYAITGLNQVHSPSESYNYCMLRHETNRVFIKVNKKLW